GAPRRPFNLDWHCHDPPPYSTGHKIIATGSAPPSGGRDRSPSDLAALVVGLGEDQRPVNLVFRGGRVHSRNAHTGRSRQQHVGTVQTRVPPARKRFRQSVIAGADILGGRPGVIARGLQTLHEWFAGSVIELVTLGQAPGPG